MKKSILRYQASKVPIDSNLNVSIVQNRISKTELRNWANKAELTDYVDQLWMPPNADYVQVICQCNAEFFYPTKDSVPSVNVTCSCGRKVIEYGN